MKQKNLILMVVAVGCGLLAAFLTSQMSAKPAAAPQQMEVLVVAKELAPGTKFTMDSIKDQFKVKKINPEAIPEKAVVTAEMLDGKTLNKTLRSDDFLRESDLGNYEPLIPPEGKHIVTIRLPVDKMTPFVQPNSKVDLVGTHMAQNGKVKSKILIPNMLVMAVDTKVQSPQGGPQGDMAVQIASLAATRDESRAIRVCEAANVKISFILRSEQGGKTGDAEEWSLQSVESWINSDDNKNVASDTEKKDETPLPEAPKDPTVKISVPTSDLPAGTELTNDVIQSKFKEINWLGAPPSHAIQNIKEHVGRFLVKDVATDQIVPFKSISDKPPQVAEAPKAKPEGASPLLKVEGPEEKAPARKLQTFDRSYTTPAGTKMYRYEVQTSGEFRLLGEVTAEGTVVPATNAPPPPAPKDAPKIEDKKDESKKTI